jgi:hypothetical protein
LDRKLGGPADAKPAKTGFIPEEARNANISKNAGFRHSARLNIPTFIWDTQVALADVASGKIES